MSLNTALNILGSGSKPGVMKTSTPSVINQKPFTVAPTPPAPQTAIKSQTVTTANGDTHKTDYHKPESTTPSPQVASSTITTPSAQSTPQVNNTPATPIPTQSTFQQSTGGLLNIGQGNNNNSTVNQANQGLLNIGQGESPEIQQARQNLLNIQNSQEKSTAGIESTAEPIEQMQGQKGVQQRLYSGLLSNAQNAYSNALASQSARAGALSTAGGLGTSQQGQNIGALGSAAGYSAPQQYGLTSQPYNPVENTYGGGGANGAIDRAVQASNIGSAQDFQSKIQSTQAAANSADANFSILNSYANQGGATGDTPILIKLQQAFGQTVGGGDSPAVAGFKAQLQAVRSAYQAITGGDPNQAIPDGITPNQLKVVQDSLKATAQNNVAGYQKQLKGLSGSSTTNDPLGIL